MKIDLNGQKALVTGGSSGIGFETAKGLIKLGAHVIITGRDKAKLDLARDFLKKDTGKDAIDVLQADFTRLSDVESVAKAATGCAVLVNNAGLIEKDRRVTGDGFERQWQVNLLAPALLMARTAKTMPEGARIVNVASGAHRRADLVLDDTGFERRKYSGLDVYGQSKLALIMLTRALSGQFEPETLMINSVHPGVVRTNFARNTGWIGVVFAAFKPFYLSARRGARTVLHAACSPFAEGMTGTYFERCAPVEPAKQALNDEKSDALLTLVNEQLGLSPEDWTKA